MKRPVLRGAGEEREGDAQVWRGAEARGAAQRQEGLRTCGGVSVVPDGKVALQRVEHRL